MFALGSGVFKEMTRKQEYFIALVGLDGAGKTTYADCARSIFDRTHQRKDPRKITSTVGLNFKLDTGQAILHFWDLGGEKGLRSLWNTYLNECDAAIFLMDATCRLKEALTSLADVFALENVSQRPVMILLNKCDLIELNGSSRTTTRSEQIASCCPTEASPHENGSIPAPTSTSTSEELLYGQSQIMAQIEEKFANVHQADSSVFSISAMNEWNVQRSVCWLLSTLREG